MKDLVIAGQTGKDVTTSLIVAKVFGKNHQHVLRDIENLSCSENFRVSNFGHTPYVHKQNKQTYKMYEMTKDGFSFLVMGYTGEKAAQFKEAFISEFNNREKMLKSDDYILARSQEILNNRLQAAQQKVQMLESENTVQREQISTMQPKAEYTDEVLQSTSTYTFTQMAKELNYSGVHTFTKKLREWKVVFRQSGQYQLTSRYAGKGYTTTRTARYFHKDGTPDTSVSTVWTEKGRWFLHKLFEKKGGAK